MRLVSPVTAFALTSPDCGSFGAPRPHCRQVRQGKATAKYKHRGIDLKANDGDPVYAAADGVVTFVGYDVPGPEHTASSSIDAAAHRYDGPGGIMVFVSHDDGFETRYMHLGGFGVSVGDQVKAGQRIATASDSGDAKGGPHLHFELLADGDHVDPIPFFTAPPTNQGNGALVCLLIAATAFGVGAILA